MPCTMVVTDDFAYPILVNDVPREMRTCEEVAAFFEEHKGI